MHNGIGVANSFGTPIVAAQNGLVSFAGWNGGYGYTVEILHSNGLTSHYAHLRSIGIKLRQSVKRFNSLEEWGLRGIPLDLTFTLRSLLRLSNTWIHSQYFHTKK